MQLNQKKPARVTATLGLLTAALLAPASAQAQDSAEKSLMTEGAAEPGTTTVDTAVLFYQETGGRVQAIEPTTSITINRTNGDTLSASLTFDSLTGATPNGAAPWTGSQTFTALIPAPSHQETTTSTSGNRTNTVVPGSGLVKSTYTTPANQIPLDSGFRDHRIAGSLGYTKLLDPDTRLRLGGAASVEEDYASYSGNVGISRDLFDKNTTLSLSGNFEYDQSKPHYGTPTGLANIATSAPGGKDHKTVVSAVAGITQSVMPFWLTQLNYSFGSSSGYQNDPYKILSLVNSVSGGPVGYLYENRPTSRTRHSVYWGNKIAIGPAVTDFSLRYYHDSWGINSLTAEVSEQVPITKSIYVEPLFRYYHQSAADFFQYYLKAGQPLPKFASADSRLSRFNAITFGAKAGFRIMPGTELYIDVESYRQTGNKTDPTAPGALSSLNLFSGVHAYSLMTGFRFKL